MKNYLSPENLNLETSQNLKDLIKASSEMDGCPIKNILNNETNSMWLSGEGMPQEIIINLKRGILKEFPKKLSAVAIYCWHAYPTNPKLIEIQISKNNENKFNSLGNFELCLKPGIQLFQLDDDSEFLINEKIQKIILKIIIKETFNGDRTYINNVYLYENIDMNYINANNISEDNVNLGNNNNNNNGLSDSSSIIYLRESREKNLPRSNFSTIGKDKLNNQLKDNLNTFSKDLTEDLLDLKSKDLGLISINNLNSNPTINLNSINLNNNLTSENNMLISDSELSERKSINRDRNLFNNDLNVSSKILEEEEEKEKSSIFNSVKKSNTTSKIFNPLKTQNSNLKNNIILTSTNNFQTDIQKEISQAPPARSIQMVWHPSPLVLLCPQRATRQRQQAGPVPSQCHPRLARKVGYLSSKIVQQFLAGAMRHSVAPELFHQRPALSGVQPIVVTLQQRHQRVEIIHPAPYHIFVKRIEEIAHGHILIIIVHI